MVMLLLTVLLALWPLFFNFAVALLIPRFCRVGAALQRALPIYDAQPVVHRMGRHASGDKVSSSSQPNLSWQKLVLAFVCNITLLFVLAVSMFFPAPLTWRNNVVVHIRNRLTFSFTTLLLTLLIFPTSMCIGESLRRWSMLACETLVFRSDDDSTFSVKRLCEKTPTKTVAAYAMLSLLIALCLQPLPAGFFTLQRVDEVTRLSTGGALVCLTLSFLWALYLFLMCLESAVTHFAPIHHRVSIWKINIFPLAMWVLWILIVALLAVSKPAPRRSPADQAAAEPEWLQRDGVADCFIFYVRPIQTTLYTFFSITAFFGFLYRYELAQQAPIGRHVDSLSTGFVEAARLANAECTIWRVVPANGLFGQLRSDGMQ